MSITRIHQNVWLKFPNKTLNWGESKQLWISSQVIQFAWTQFEGFKNSFFFENRRVHKIVSLATNHWVWLYFPKNDESQCWIQKYSSKHPKAKTNTMPYKLSVWKFQEAAIDSKNNNFNHFWAIAGFWSFGHLDRRVSWAKHYFRSFAFSFGFGVEHSQH